MVYQYVKLRRASYWNFSIEFDVKQLWDAIVYLKQISYVPSYVLLLHILNMYYLGGTLISVWKANLKRTNLNMYHAEFYRCCIFNKTVTNGLVRWFPWLTNWGWVTHLCVSKLTIIGSDNGLAPAGISLIGPLGINFSEIWIEIHAFSFIKMHLKMSSGKWRAYCLGLNLLMNVLLFTSANTENVYSSCMPPSE